MATERITVTGKSGLDLREMRKLSRDLKAFKPDKQLKKTLKLAGELIADEARIIVLSYRSKSEQAEAPEAGERREMATSGGRAGGSATAAVAASIKVRMRKTAITVEAGGRAVPLAGLWELGNKGKGRSQDAARRGDHFRHPVFGRRSDQWVAQRTAPFLQPALERNIKNIEALEGHAVADAMREVGFHVT